MFELSKVSLLYTVSENDILNHTCIPSYCISIHAFDFEGF